MADQNRIVVTSQISTRLQRSRQQVSNPVSSIIHGSGLNLLCLQSHSKPECRWTGPEVVIFGADQKERGLWGREWTTVIKFRRDLLFFRLV